jgi:chorismate dehydratase
LEAVLLIGDKVVDPRRSGFAYEVDLGGAWRQHTGLPFVFAVWAARAAGAPGDWATAPDRQLGERFEILAEARDRGVARAAEIAREQGPPWAGPRSSRSATCAAG